MIYHGDMGLSDLATVVRKTCSDLRKHAGEFDSIAVRGISGLVVGAPVALRLGQPLIISRKPVDKCHGTLRVENFGSAGRYIILDDIAASGDTLRAVRRDVAVASPRAVCVAVYLYAERDWRPGFSTERSQGIY